MKKTAALISLTLLSLAAQAEGVTFNTPVTYTQPVTYAAGVTYLAPVTYSETRQLAALNAAAAPVMLDGVIVTPSRTYSEAEWRAVRLARAEQKSRNNSTRYLQVRAENAPPSDGAMTRLLRLLVQ